MVTVFGDHGQDVPIAVIEASGVRHLVFCVVQKIDTVSRGRHDAVAERPKPSGVNNGPIFTCPRHISNHTFIGLMYAAATHAWAADLEPVIFSDILIADFLILIEIEIPLEIYFVLIIFLHVNVIRPKRLFFVIDYRRNSLFSPHLKPATCLLYITFFFHLSPTSTPSGPERNSFEKIGKVWVRLAPSDRFALLHGATVKTFTMAHLQTETFHFINHFLGLKPNPRSKGTHRVCFQPTFESLFDQLDIVHNLSLP